MGDFRMIETNDGGDFVLIGADLQMIDGFQNMPYIGLFGGNVESNTQQFLPTEQRFDFWGNNLLMLNNAAVQFNSNTERILNQSALTSSARLQIENAVKADLDFFRSFATVSVAASITATDRIEINIRIVELATQESTEFVYIWDSTEQELELIN